MVTRAPSRRPGVAAGWTDSERRAVAILVATLGAALIEPGTPEHSTGCYRCGRPVTVALGAAGAVCARCAGAELGTTAYALGLASEFHLSVKTVERRLERFGPPSVSPKEWLTPRSRLRK